MKVSSYHHAIKIELTLEIFLGMCPTVVSTPWDSISNQLLVVILTYCTVKILAVKALGNIISIAKVFFHQFFQQRGFVTLFTVKVFYYTVWKSILMIKYDFYHNRHFFAMKSSS